MNKHEISLSTPEIVRHARLILLISDFWLILTVFLYLNSIEGEYVPREGDEVTYRLCPIPPKIEKFQAIHVRIINFTPDVHLKWDAPIDEAEKTE